MTRWRYNCHMCGEVICDDCSPFTAMLPPVWVTEPVRVCKACMPEVSQRTQVKKDGGRVLGGSTAPALSEDQERERRARLAEERANRGNRPAVAPTRQPAKPNQTSNAQPAQSSLGGGREEPQARQEGSNPMLEAALRRQQQRNEGSSNQPAADPEKAALLSQIAAVYRGRGDTEPFGLRSMDVPRLRLHLKHLQDGKR